MDEEKRKDLIGDKDCEPCSTVALKTVLAFTVYGTAQPQGSIRAFMPKGSKRPVLTSDNSNLKPWRQEVAWAAKYAARGWKLIDRPLAVGLKATFYFVRPQRGKGLYKSTKPDSDKLFRALGDALTGIVYRDDAQISDARVLKLFADTPRVEVEVWQL